jgi:hypothetical protein
VCANEVTKPAYFAGCVGNGVSRLDGGNRRFAPEAQLMLPLFGRPPDPRVHLLSFWIWQVL